MDSDSVFDSLRTDLFCDSQPGESKSQAVLLFMSEIVCAVEAYASVWCHMTMS